MAAIHPARAHQHVGNFLAIDSDQRPGDQPAVADLDAQDAINALADIHRQVLCDLHGGGHVVYVPDVQIPLGRSCATGGVQHGVGAHLLVGLLPLRNLLLHGAALLRELIGIALLYAAPLQPRGGLLASDVPSCLSLAEWVRG